MDPSNSSVHKRKDVDEPQNQKPQSQPQEVKPVKTLNRVPRTSSNACRKQKMRCEGADNPPCKRCRNAGLECMFEKPSKEASLTGEAGLERIRSLENRVAEIGNTQIAIRDAILDLASLLRLHGLPGRSPPSVYPGLQSPASSTPSSTHHITPAPISEPYSHASVNGLTRHHTGNSISQAFASLSGTQNPMPNSTGNYQTPQAQYGYPQDGMQYPYSNQGLQEMHSQYKRTQSTLTSTPTSMPAGPSTSGDSSDLESDDNGELPASGLVAPWQVLNGLADVAIAHAAKESGDLGESQSRAMTPDEERQGRPSKKRKLRHRQQKGIPFPDVVAANIISEQEARDLFKIYFEGCSTFLPVFDKSVDTFEDLHSRSPFAFDAICMVAARVRDGGGQRSETYKKCLQEVQKIACATLFAPVTRFETIQAMILISGWSDDGWLSGGHAVRMALECSMHKSWPKLFYRITHNQASRSQEDRDLITATRIWFTLYLFEHQLSYGTGRPAILKDDDSIRHGRAILQHPLAVEDDMRLVSTVELMALRERINNALAPLDAPIRDSHFESLRQANLEFHGWFATWDQAFSQKYEDAAFYRQSLQIQHIHAELYHNATCLRGINGPEDVQNMPQIQRDLAIRSITIARQALDITVNSLAYREGMKYAVHYTHVTATFSASLLLRLARLFPDQCDIADIRMKTSQLAEIMSRIPGGKRYALTLQLMLKRSKRRSVSVTAVSPASTRDSRQGLDQTMRPGLSMGQNGVDRYSAFELQYPQPSVQQPQQQMGSHAFQASTTSDYQNLQQMDADYIWSGFEQTSNDQLPVWITDDTLGGQTFSQNGMAAFMLPEGYLQPSSQIIF
ncbi:hypothetical protein FISHEDRAFT_48819 [Fistulina hepatica ATCC 64428]|uniref:Zn(2)-C6 fungal-type domain-containing protein n=1 Tax=Fistulina hepatica ATCC 64428 TaxID=1128425 RepID=A0A0D7A788_9AGAR|nr:hypothetical protein FISHEDRAFT_48819 [Fistulina hepatica ATCC 64428]